MNKKILFSTIITLAILAVIIILIVYRQTKTCGDNACNSAENNTLVEINSCQKLNLEKETYVLTKNLEKDNCLEVNADSITIDCNNFKIIGNNNIFSNKDLANFKLKNCEIENLDTKKINLLMIVNSKVNRINTASNIMFLTHSLVNNLITTQNSEVNLINSKLESTNIPQENLTVLKNNNPDVFGKRRFAMEEFNFGIAKELIELGDGLSQSVGLKFTYWKGMQPEPPKNRVAAYTRISDFNGWQFAFLNNFESTSKEFSGVIEFEHMDWAMEYSDILVQSPASGEKVPGFVRIKPEHEQDWKNFIKYYVSVMPNLRYIQIDNEADNVWVNGEGYARALKLAHDAVQEYNIENGTDIKVLAAGFNLVNLVNLPESVQQHMYEKHPNIDHEWILDQINLEGLGIKKEDVSSEKLNYISQKIHITLSAINQKEPIFDILTIHSNEYNLIEDLDVRVDWFRQQMKKNGYEKPIWIDDMHASYIPNIGNKGTDEDRELFEGLKAGDLETIAQYNKDQSKWLVKRAIGHFGAGVERVLIPNSKDITWYFMPDWRYNGLFTEDLNPKASYYTTKIMIEKLDYFETATRINLNEKDYLYKFTFKDKNAVYVGWSENRNISLDLSDELGDANVKITFLVSEVDEKYSPIIKSNQVVSTKQIPLSTEPVFIELK